MYVSYAFGSVDISGLFVIVNPGVPTLEPFKAPRSAPATA